MTNVAVVTGGTRGIGLSISKALKDEGYHVIAAYVSNQDAADHFVKEVGGTAVQLDVTNLEACMEASADIEQRFGPIDVLVNNAGITRDGTLHKMTEEQWSDVIHTNLYSCFNMCRAIVPGMRDRKFGRIINISSINGQKGQFGQCNYAAAKAGMIGFGKSLALESAAKGITVNTVCPGYIATEMTKAMKPEVLESIINEIPEHRMGTPEEIAALVAFLASDKAAFITGATFAANGGQYMA